MLEYICPKCGESNVVQVELMTIDLHIVPDPDRDGEPMVNESGDTQALDTLYYRCECCGFMTGKERSLQRR